MENYEEMLSHRYGLGLIPG